MKITKIKKKTVLERDFWKSKNFWTGLVTSILLILKSFGIDIPENAVGVVIDAVFPFDLTAFIVSVANVGNIIYHLVKNGGSKQDLVNEVERLAEELKVIKAENIELTD